MGVASHLKIDLADYDYRIRTFIPWYDEMLDVAAGALALVRSRRPAILDLGIGTGALAERCLRTRPRARLTGIDGDAEILAAAGRRLRSAASKVTLAKGDFERIPFGRVDAIVASLSLHHVRTPARKRRLYARASASLAEGGVLISADCAPASDAGLARAQHEVWRAHMLQTYARREVGRYFRAWARDDVYMPLATELVLLGDAGFRSEVLWRRGPFAVIAARRRARRPAANGSRAPVP